jgi:nitrite reductase/ring-hydroxylating ferredoxin subunit
VADNPSMSESTGDWVDVAGVEDLTERKAHRANLGGQALFLLRVDEAIFAIGNQCTHQGAGLDKGVINIAGSVRTVTCPAHGSVFRLDDGKVMRPPAMKPVQAYDAKIEDGRIFVRSRE